MVKNINGDIYSDLITLRRGERAVVPALIHHHIQQRDERAYGDAKYRPGGA